MDIISDERFNATVIDIALPDGAPVARYGGMVVFLDKGVVGDVIEGRIILRKKKFAYGIVDSIVTPSVNRVVPECRYFGSCGGCVCQDMSYDRQLVVKRNYLSKTLKSMGNVEPSLLESIVLEPSVNVYRYRNKISFSFGLENGKPVIGLQQKVFPPGSKNPDVIKINECPIFGNSFEPLLRIIEEHFSAKEYSVYDPVSKSGFLRNLVIRRSQQTGDLQVVLYTMDGSVSDMDGLYRKVIEALPAVKSFYHIIHTHSFDSFGDYRIAACYGDSAIIEECGGIRLKVYPQTFIQPNTLAANLMYNTIQEWVKQIQPVAILGLYCGSAAMELSVASFAKKITGVDANPTNIVAALENAQLNTITNCRFINHTVEQFLKTQKRIKPSLILIDPPRNGISKHAISAIAGLNAGYILYISCNAASLSRDIAVLQTKGYAPVKIHAFDQFPHTGHIESMVLLRRI